MMDLRYWFCIQLFVNRADEHIFSFWKGIGHWPKTHFCENRFHRSEDHKNPYKSRKQQHQKQHSTKTKTKESIMRRMARCCTFVQDCWTWQQLRGKTGVNLLPLVYILITINLASIDVEIRLCWGKVFLTFLILHITKIWKDPLI